jgi:pterin-4a-carbinolamine dehydratase
MRSGIMELNGSKLKDRTLHAMHKLKDNIKETFYSIADIPSSSIQELAEFIQHHPDTQVINKHYLGNTYTFSRLNLKDSHFYLETRTDRILQLDGYSNGKKFVSYRSYRDFNDLHSPVKLR